MSGALVLAEARSGEVHDVTGELISAARSVCDDVTLLIVDEQAAALAETLCAGPLTGVLCASIESSVFRPLAVRQALEAAILRLAPEVVLLAHTNDNLGVGPAVAAASSYCFASDVLGLARDGKNLTARRGAFGGKLEAELGFDHQATTVLLVRLGCFPAAIGSTEATRSVLQVGALAGDAIEHLGYEEAPSDDSGVASADVVVAIGRGVEDPSQIAGLQELAVKLGGALAASRPLIDSGWVSPSRQIGQSGASVAPRVYLALGVSGAAEHLVGIRAAETVIAVNCDPSAPIFGIAHYGVLGDLVEISHELRRLLG